MSEKHVKSMIGKVFNDIANGIETGQFRQRVRVGITTLGSELGADNLIKGAEMAARKDTSIEVVLIGPKSDSHLSQEIANTEDEVYEKMEELLSKGEIDASVTMHYNFPIGVSTVGRTITPALGKEMYIATTTGTSSAHRIEAMVLNGINGIITAKAMGIKDPTVGILNVDGARQVEKIFKELIEKGYRVNFTESERSDGGFVMRGNDLLKGVPDIMINDTLTGNILMKMFSSFTTGGSFESSGYGYGPGIGENYDPIVLILSRASGSPVVSNAILYAGELIKGDLKSIKKEEFEKANKAGLKDILKAATKDKEKNEEEISPPTKEMVTETIGGIDIMELEDAVKELWKNNIYAESGMGCTGPIVMINENKLCDAIKVLKKSGYAVEDRSIC
jgi:glycine/sarcosine/betaine reductase complex component C subunit alpha